MVKYQISDLNFTDVLAAEFRKSIMSAIPRIIPLLSDSVSDVSMTGVRALLKLSQQGRVTNFLT